MAESGKNGRGPSMNVDTKLVRELAKLLSETGLTEIEVQDGDRRIKVGRGAVAAPATAPTAVEAALPQEEPLPPLADTALVPVGSPTLVAILRAEALSVMAACRKGALLSRDAVARLWLSVRIWISERIRHRNAHS